jgi:hypothetical protein
VKTFAVIAAAGFAIFLMTAAYLLRGGEKSHVAQPAPPAAPRTTAVESRPRGKPAVIINSPRASEPGHTGVGERTLREEPEEESTR